MYYITSPRSKASHCFILKFAVMKSGETFLIRITKKLLENLHPIDNLNKSETA